MNLKVANRQDTVTAVETNEYVVPDAATVSKTDIPIVQIPFAVQVVPTGVIQDQLALRLPDITRNVSGVQTNFGYGALYEAFALRGFETNVTLQRVSGGIGLNQSLPSGGKRSNIPRLPAAPPGYESDIPVLADA
jgi:outer membrane receptor protein involved in Fe transport